MPLAEVALPRSMDLRKVDTRQFVAAIVIGTFVIVLAALAATFV